MNVHLRKKAYDLFYDKYGKTPLDADLPVIVYDNEAGGFFYSTSEKKIETFSHNRELTNKLGMRCLLTITAMGVCLVIFVTIMLHRDPELCLLLSKIWGFFGLGLSVLALIFIWIKKDNQTVFIPFEAPDNWLDD